MWQTKERASFPIQVKLFFVEESLLWRIPKLGGKSSAYSERRRYYLMMVENFHFAR